MRIVALSVVRSYDENVDVPRCAKAKLTSKIYSIRIYFFLQSFAAKNKVLIVGRIFAKDPTKDTTNIVQEILTSGHLTQSRHQVGSFRDIVIAF